ncbi:hypothetical protein [Maridesulfovibrio sp.]|uniref:hypothetical protein n=1 Tax=Maridesulfovibrio sp. TaxID=2795000 RepID=UPI002A18BC5D|nr:hypothetical protein [Maridesulfovibrio sp.]
MRISRYGGGKFQSGGGGASERSAKFRKKYKVGEIVQGTLLRWEQSGLGWVQIDELLLLASIATSPAPGDVLTFVVLQLYPDIVLKEVGPDDFNEQGRYISPVDATRNFVRTRAAFQSRARAVFEELSARKELDADGRMKLMLELLEADRDSTVLFFETQRCVADLNSVLRSSRLYYMPWLVPSALNVEIVLKIKEPDEPETSFYELLLSMDVPPAVPVRYRMMYKKPGCSFKLLADDANIRTLLGVHFKHCFPEFIGAEKIPAQSSGGFLAELLSA